MAYTVKQLAEISKVSVRTLHYYDEIGLLQPAYHGDQGYRYYEEEQLLRLQQILFYRELGFPLNNIQRIMGSNDFDKITALNSHRKVIKSELANKSQLLKTIDKTIQYLEGKVKMKDEELYYGFDSKKQKEHEKYLVDSGILTQDFLDECNKKTKNWSDAEKNAFIKDSEKIMQALIISIEKNVDPAAAEVQELMRRHYVWLERTWTPNKDSYLGLTQLYQTPEFRVFYDSRHPKLLEFTIEAMKIFAESSL